eukprot:365451-Chlamydomonas_euryale.AAC.6
MSRWFEAAVWRSVSCLALGKGRLGGHRHHLLAAPPPLPQLHILTYSASTYLGQGVLRRGQGLQG